MSNYSGNEYKKEDPQLPWTKIIPLVVRKSRVLDIGCSSGNLGLALQQEKDCEVIGLDLDEQDVETARTKLTAAHVLNVEKDDLSHLGNFDHVIFADVIEHLVDPVATLIKIKNLLNNPGSVIFSIPNMAHMGMRLMLLEGRFTYGETGLLDKTHLHYYDLQEIKRIFKAAGYGLEVLDWIERYIPEKVLEHALTTIGVRPDEKFYKKSKQIEAIAYEYVGKASYSLRPKHVPSLPFVSPNVLTTEEYIKHVEGLYAQELARVNKNKTHVIEKLKQKNEDLLAQQNAILSSISWKISKPLRLAGKLARQVQHIKNTAVMTVRKTPMLNFLNYPGIKSSRKIYQRNDSFMKRIKRNRDVKTAIVLHLFYIEAWPKINEKINRLHDTLPFDLFVTLPAENMEFANKIRLNYPSAYIFQVPNRGRDVLPFLKIAKHLEKLGYTYLLKLHSKKSPHRKDGQEWFNAILNNLLPKDRQILNGLVATLEDKHTGVIGPAGQYVSLSVNFMSNFFLLSKTLSKLFSKNTSRRVCNGANKFGFFAGTMFWARIDALSTVLNQDMGPASFEREKGAIDATMAHALERILSLCPEIENKKLFEVGPAGVEHITYQTGNIPEWSDLHRPGRKKK